MDLTGNGAHAWLVMVNTLHVGLETVTGRDRAPGVQQGVASCSTTIWVWFDSRLNTVDY